MTWIETLQRAIDYIEAHLLEDIHFEDVAKEMNLSAYEFHRAFSFMSGMTLTTYIRNRRLSLAGQELAHTEEKIIDMATKYGYDSPDSFTKAFTRFHGIAPKYAKYTGTQLVLFDPLFIKVTMEGGKKIDYRIEQEPKRRYLAIVRDFPVEIIHEEGNHDIADFWSECNENHWIEPLKALCNGGDGAVYGLCAPLRSEETSFAYGIGVRIDEKQDKIEECTLKDKGYQIWETEANTYVVFRCVGDDGDSISNIWESFYKEFLPQSGYEICVETDYEIYFEESKEDLFCELWIPIRKL